ncbi:Methyltransferase type 11 (modular protein) [Acetoanaerobium sticklandii]|uniref:Methyltransferase type 11 (Modular protein) n=2 Tax=Acetoanaerobium sticklandii TaxID=1511 RepID=E3PTD3_ACESD|nr:Methyltransferase type 11 (modular protein) [Acetoanaerobium sticklandii]
MRISNNMVETIITKFKSLFYKKNETKAMEILKDKNKVSKLLEEAMNKAKANRIGPIDEIWSKLQIVFSLLKDWISGEYKQIPMGSLMILVVGLIYFITPIDILPDLIPGGFVDDVVIFGFLFKQISADIDAYRSWKEEKAAITFYEKNGDAYADETLFIDMSDVYERFEVYLKDGDNILDAGCGAGRDSKHFLEKGYDVTSFDGCKKLAQRASSFIGKSVINMKFTELNYNEDFNAIWACSSLIHLTRKAFVKVLLKFYEALKPEGHVYISLKYGDSEKVEDGRVFTSYTQSLVKDIIDTKTPFKIEEIWITSDKRVGRENEKWLNVILYKS